MITNWHSFNYFHRTHVKFYNELLNNAVQAAILDFFDFHSSINNGNEISTQNALLMNRFFALLEAKSYRQCREVSYYADILCVTPKYLSEVSKKISGFPANYWITRFTIQDIAQLLRDKTISFVQISDMFNFSSPTYFGRYVQRNLGVNPSQYRE